MRIGRLNQILKTVCDEQNQIKIKATPVFGGNAYDIANYGDIRLAVKALYNNKLINAGVEQVDDLFNEHTEELSLRIDASMHNHLSSLVSTINANLPLIMQVTDSFSPDQDENIINIKLPNDINLISDYDKYNKRIKNVFTKFGISSDDMKIVGFDVGCKWYQLLLENAQWIIPCVISSISLALQTIEFKRNKKTNPETRIEVNVINSFNNNDKDITEDEYIDRLVSEKVENEVAERIEKVGSPGGKTKEESISMIINATKELIREIEKGTEFHLSLNPPEYAKESSAGTSIEIDYGSIPREVEVEKKTKELKDRITKDEK